MPNNQNQEDKINIVLQEAKAYQRWGLVADPNLRARQDEEQPVTQQQEKDSQGEPPLIKEQ